MLLKLFIPALIAASLVAGETANLTIFYETHCPSCQVTYPQMSAIVRKLGRNVALRTIPFGNAMFVNGGIVCQHGASECYGNKLHACAIDQLKQIQAFVDFNSCMIQGNSDDASAVSCGHRLGVSSGVVNAITQCAKSSRGQELVEGYGKVTVNYMRGRDSYTPYILINNRVMDPDYSDRVFQQVCAAFTNPPDACY